mmetsp:Transcript_135658/g.421469  ORF Transcript_135658/g.421469 Transcript_135658/m.421469 type:complete len:399 (+) Transcript_135658:77-1273(+)
MSGLEDLRVYGESSVGWDERTLPNETVDDDGNPFPASGGFAIPDPRAPARRSPDDPGVQRLREHLRQHNGIQGLEICRPDEVERAARIFHRDGFVVVRDLLNPEQLERMRRASARVLRELLEPAAPGGRKHPTESGRLPHRYSYGTCSGSRHMLHDPDWGMLIDLPTTTPILTKIFGSPDYLVTGCGGDLCLPGAVEYQHLHRDAMDPHHLPEGRLEQARGVGVSVKPGAELSHRRRGVIMEKTPPSATINFLMSDLTWENGPIRQIPGTHATMQEPPPPADEPDWMRLSTLVGAPAGAGVFRDHRAWHGATPNLSREVRCMPNIEFGAPWVGSPHMAKTMPHEVWAALSPHAQRLCRFVVERPGTWPRGAGVMHAFAGQRGLKTMPVAPPKSQRAKL